MILSTDEKVQIKANLFKLCQTVHQMKLDRETHNKSFPQGQVFYLLLDKFEPVFQEGKNSIVSQTFFIKN